MCERPSDLCCDLSKRVNNVPNVILSIKDQSQCQLFSLFTLEYKCTWRSSQTVEKRKNWLVGGWSCMLAMSSTTIACYLVIISLTKSLKIDIRKVFVFVILCTFCLSKSLVFCKIYLCKNCFFYLTWILLKFAFCLGFCKILVFVSTLRGILRPAVLRIATQRQLSIAPRCKLPALFPDCIQPLCIMDNWLKS